jgi:hypothetical protein
MRFSIASILFATLAIAAILATSFSTGIESLPLLLPHVVYLIIFFTLRRRGKRAWSLAIVTVYLLTWLLTACISPQCIKSQCRPSPSSTDIWWKYSPNMYPPFVSRGRSIQYDPPSHYCHILSTPCPLFTIVDHGMLNEAKVGGGGRSWFVWIGITSIPVWRSSWLIQN